MKNLLSNISKHIVNIPGFRTRRRIVVFESDDWGSIRMPNSGVFQRFKKQGMNLTNSNYNKFDSLESNDDLVSLFNVLSSFKDCKGQHPVLTANVIVGNPDFDRIKASEFNNYYFEPVIKTLERYPNREKVFKLWTEGNEAGLFHPQFHGREHVNFIRWMDALRTQSTDIMFTFNQRTTFSGNGDYNFMEVLDFNSPEDLSVMQKSLEEGLNLFNEIFGYKSSSFIPPCYTWDSSVEDLLFKNGVKYIQGLVIQLVPRGSFGDYKKKYHYCGQKSPYGPIYLIRNAFFEPSLTGANNPVDEVLRRISIAFKWNKPAIIGTHRINFIGSIDPANRDRNLNYFENLLHEILKKWPDTEFMSTDQLGDLITKRSQELEE